MSKTSGADRTLVPSGHVTYHLIPLDVWIRKREEQFYVSEGYTVERFVHCTDDFGRLMEVGNRYYREDARAYAVLRVECDAVSAKVVYEDTEHHFPHIYGPVEIGAITLEGTVERRADGSFVSVRR